MALAVDTHSINPETLVSSLEHIATNLRPADLDEVRAQVGSGEIKQLLQGALTISTASWLITDDMGLPLGLFGVAPLVPKVGSAWLLGTNDMVTNAMDVFKYTRKYIRKMHETYPVLHVNVDARNELSIRWLEWAGFVLTDSYPAFGPERRLFHQFIRTA